jgi:membrane protease YdiL (CAAX protease family)
MLPGLLAGVLYGGLTEEVMMRWGLMTLVVWGALRLFARGDTRARPHDRRSSAICVTAIVVVALVFAAGHLPAAAAMAPLTSLGITRILSLNTIAGMLFGWLYWRRSLEAAMIAHASVHVAFAVARVLHGTTP